MFRALYKTASFCRLLIEALRYPLEAANSLLKRQSKRNDNMRPVYSQDVPVQGGGSDETSDNERVN